MLGVAVAINDCSHCLEKQREIDDLKEENARLRAKLNQQQRRVRDGAFGLSTPSSKIPIKPNSEKKDKKPKGARLGHTGNGRKDFNKEPVDNVVEVESQFETCPECGRDMEKKGLQERSVIESASHKPEKILFLLPKRYCNHCRRSFTPQPPGVLPKSLYGNQLIADAITMYYLHGLPMGRISNATGIGAGALMEIYHRIGRLFDGVLHKLIEEYRQAPVKHADETSWRTDGKNGYVWLFATSRMSIFQYGKNRSSQVPHTIFGKDLLPGVLVVDRYGGYNKVPCEIQYCYAHLLRDIQDLEKEFPEEKEITTFVAVTAPLLSLAMGLRSQPITDKQYYRKASKLAGDIKNAMNRPALHQGIRRIQDIFRQNEHRMYQWVANRSVPPDNNLAERDLRPSVIARKVSFGSVTENGAKTRSILTSIVTTLKKRGSDPTEYIKDALDKLAKDMKQDPYPLLFPKGP